MGGYPLPPNPDNPGHGRVPGDGNACPPCLPKLPNKEWCNASTAGVVRPTGLPYEEECPTTCEELATTVTCQNYERCNEVTIIGGDRIPAYTTYYVTQEKECGICPDVPSCCLFILL